ncbi:IPT/TIG domain-containing protein [Actinoplanes couchii]|uniref:IPT/TIG domain-containing protein n=1 Tax=Actinoplanes couchii TaxID=403638 RepID=A0ABQ3X4T0_9ACTN|nr:IPT/TIG domain-containing protein [Actinoplanes couchii]MDR6326116.1 hypothetical protein [Actinoplanes couchii]GID53530.1 hypothetical protein Aco03nite_019340 [Actinoplanes couchii]
MSKSRTSFRRTVLHAGIATATTIVATTAVATPVFANAPLTLNVTSANATQITAGVNVIATASTNWLANVSGGKVFFTTATCPTSYPASTPSWTPSGDLTKFSATKGFFKVATGLPASTATSYKVCVYAGTTTGDAYIGTGTFAAAPAPVLTSLDVVTGPAAGGTTVTVTGSGLPTTAAGYASATLGGVNVGTITAGSATKFSFTTPARAPSGTAQPLVVNFATAGSVTLDTAFTYYNAITVAPNVGRQNTDTYINITGAGFNALSWGALASTGAHVYLTHGAYDKSFTDAYKVVTECDNASIVPVSDNEIICLLKLSATLSTTPAAVATPVSNGAYTVTVVDNGAKAAATVNPSIVSPSATFTVATVTS